jgi:hypothetical protein
MTAAALCRNMATLKRCAAGISSRERPQQETGDEHKVIQRSLHGKPLSLDAMYCLKAAEGEPWHITAEDHPARLCRVLLIPDWCFNGCMIHLCPAVVAPGRVPAERCPHRART